MALARQMASSEMQGPIAPPMQSWNYAFSYANGKASDNKSVQLLSTTIVTKRTPATSQALGPMSRAKQPYVTIYDYFSRPAHALLHPVSTIEYYWALRAARAEALLGAHIVHKQELNYVSAAYEERRSVSVSTKSSVSEPQP